ncbi:MAG: aldo/keto reductase [Rhizobiaceae bacterium]
MMIDRFVWSGPPPSRLALGCEPLGGTDWGDVDLDNARLAVSTALDVGITVFDTADVYGLGRSEEELAAALGPRRHDAFIVTKFGVRWERDPSGGRARTFRDSSPAHLTAALEASLRRLRIDAVPLYLVHWPDPATPIDDTLEVLRDARTAGKVLNFGLSNFTPDDVEKGAGLGIAAVEAQFNLIDLNSSRGVWEVAGRHGLARIAYGPLAQGLLTGKYDQMSRFPPSDRRSRLPHFDARQWERNRRILGALEEVAKRRGVTTAQVALRWVLDCSMVDMAVVGGRSPDQVVANAAAETWMLEADEVAALTQAAILEA